MGKRVWSHEDKWTGDEQTNKKMDDKDRNMAKTHALSRVLSNPPLQTMTGEHFLVRRIEEVEKCEQHRTFIIHAQCS